MANRDSKPVPIWPDPGGRQKIDDQQRVGVAVGSGGLTVTWLPASHYMVYSLNAMVKPRFLIRVIMVAIVAGMVAGVTARGDAPNRAGLVVVHGDGQVVTRCVEFTEEQITGYDLLVRSGLDLNYEAQGGLGTAICRLDNEGCNYPEDQCFCRCLGSPCVFWSLWQWVDDDWVFSSQGASATVVTDETMQAWVWGEGTIGTAASPPPPVSFGEVCLLPVLVFPIVFH